MTVRATGTEPQATGQLPFESTAQKLRRNAEKSSQLSFMSTLDEPMDQWPDNIRGVPNALIRCALFKASQCGKSEDRPFHKEAVIASMGGMRISYKGEELDQRDLDVWSAVLHLYRSQNINEVVRVSSRQLLALAGLTNAGPNHRALKERLKRLQFTQIVIESEDESTSKFTFIGSLIDSAERTPEGLFWELRLAPRIRSLFIDGYSWLDWEIRDSLKRSPLAQWCYTFFRSHRKPFPMTIPTLLALSGSGSQELRFFRNDIKKALRRVADACMLYGLTFAWDYEKKGDKIIVSWQQTAQVS